VGPFLFMRGWWRTRKKNLVQSLGIFRISPPLRRISFRNLSFNPQIRPQRYSPAGRFTFQKINQIKFDSSQLAQFNEKLMKFNMDSLDSYPISTRICISIIYKENSGYNLMPIDSISYGQIRTKASIMGVVMSDLPYLRYAYNWRLRQKPGLKGKIYVKFAIN